MQHPWESSRAGRDPHVLVPLPLQHPPDQSCIVPVSAAHHRTSVSPDPQGPTTPLTAQQALHLLSCLCPQILLLLPVFSISSTTHGFPPEPLPAHTPTEHESSWAYLDGAKHFIENAFNSGAPCGPREEKHVDKAGNLLFGFCTELLAESRPALLKPRQAVQCQASSAGRGPCASPQCGQSWGLPG